MQPRALQQVAIWSNIFIIFFFGLKNNNFQLYEKYFQFNFFFNIKLHDGCLMLSDTLFIAQKNLNKLSLNVGYSKIKIPERVPILSVEETKEKKIDGINEIK